MFIVSRVMASKAAKGFVHQQDFRIVNQGERERDTLLHSTRKPGEKAAIGY
jgi:hypothetical protein